MDGFKKNKILSTIIAFATLMLTVVAIFTAINIYKLKTQPVTPNAPEITMAIITPTTKVTTSTPTNSPVTGTPNPTNTPPQKIATKTPTPSTSIQTPATITPKPTTPSDTLPDAGISHPTIILLTFGVLLFTFALLILF